MASFAYYCPICGKGTNDALSGLERRPGQSVHQCSRRSIARIDGTHNSEVREILERRSFGSRLEEGFAMLSDDETE